MLGVLLRAIYSQIIIIIQLLRRGGSTEDLGCFVENEGAVKAGFRFFRCVASFGAILL